MNIKYLYGFLALIGIELLGNNLFAQFYNGLNQNFGKNRVQYDDFFWTYYQMDRYNIYFYTGGEKTAEYTAKTALSTMKELEKQFDFYTNDKIHFVIYNKLSEFRQSNIGLAADKNQSTTSGVTRISASKIFLYFEGDYTKLDEQIRSGLAEIMINRMMYGENWREVLKNSTLLTIPDWFTKGIVSYMTSPWNSEIDNRVRDGIQSGLYQKYNRLNNEEALYAGHALWNFIAEVHGKAVIPNILYMARVSRNIESGFLFVLGISLNTLVEESYLHYQIRYDLDEENSNDPNGEKLKIRSKKRWNYTDFKLSPDGNYAAFVRNNMGKYKVYLYDFEKGKTKKIFKKGIKIDRINDFNYPHLTWHPNNEIVSIITEEHSQNYLRIYNLTEKKMYIKPIFQLDIILDAKYSQDGKELILSAAKGGQADIFVLNVASNTMKQLNKDIFDDLNPDYLQSKSFAVFSSNRTSDTLVDEKNFNIKSVNKPSHDIFLYDINSPKKPFTRLTETPDADERNPAFYKDNKFVILSDENGIRNRFMLELDSAILSIDTTVNYRYFTKSYPISNYKRNILLQDVNAISGDYGEMIYKNRKFEFYKGNIEQDMTKMEPEIPVTQFKVNQNENGEFEEVDVEKDITYVLIDVFEDYESENDYVEGLIDINNYKFEDEIEVKDNPAQKPEKEKSRVKKLATKAGERSDDGAEIEIFLPQRRNYSLNFTANALTSTVDYNFATDLYQPFNGGPYVMPGLGAVMKIGMEDLFEDYLIEGGGRLPFGNAVNEYFISVENRSRRLDKKYTIIRQDITNVGITEAAQTSIHQFKTELKYPFNDVFGLKTTLSYRNDQIISKSTDNQTLQRPNQFVNWLGGKFELIFDNSRSVMLNIENGTKFKAFFESYFEAGEADGDIHIAGFDFRHHQRIHRELTFSFRAAGSTSFGGRKLVYYMGAVDNWFTLGDREKFDFETPISNEQNYYWQTLATNMRGFIQNSRNGNSMLVINNELRLPFVKYLAPKPLKNEFFANLQANLFADIGTAWNGRTPYSEDNAFNTVEIIRPPITVRLDNKRDPIIGAYGFGFRSKIFGYFLRFDYAWGVEDRIIRDPIIHLSLGKDF